MLAKLTSLRWPPVSRSYGPALFDAVIRMLGTLTLVAAVVLASWWMTRLTAPRPVAKLPSTPVALSENNLILVSKLFGTGALQAQTQTLEGVKLTGIFAGAKGGGFAIFRTRAGEISAFAGDEVVPGIKLKEIQDDRVILMSGGVQNELRLRDANEPIPPTEGQAPVADVSQITSLINAAKTGRATRMKETRR